MHRIIKVLIVDDEDLARRKIIRYLEEWEEDFQVAEAINGIEALSKIQTFEPNIVFLDIQMPGMSGFDVLYHIDNRSFQVIFQTAHDDFAVNAFEENACDYLLKPFSRDRFGKALSKALKTLQNENLDKLERHLKSDGHYLEKIAVRSSGDRHILNISDIDCFIANDHYSCIYIGTKEFLSEMSLSKIESGLDPKKFIRIHRKAIVSVASIKSLSNHDKNEVTLQNGMKIQVSRRCRPGLVEILKR